MDRRTFLFTALACTRLPGGPWFKRKEPDLKTYITKNLHHSLQRHPNKTKIINRYVKVINQYADKYCLPVMIVAKVIKVESGFRWWVKSEKGASGPMQIMTKVWSGTIHHALNKRQRIEAINSKKPLLVYEKYVKQIGIGVDVGCKILKHYFDEYQDMSLALMAYNNGPYSKRFKSALRNMSIAHKNKYVRSIL